MRSDLLGHTFQFTNVTNKAPTKSFFYHYIVHKNYGTNSLPEKKYNFQEVEKKKISRTQREFFYEKRKKNNLL